jgi:hypothetical protein
LPQNYIAKQSESEWTKEYGGSRKTTIAYFIIRFQQHIPFDPTKTAMVHKETILHATE